MVKDLENLTEKGQVNWFCLGYKAHIQRGSHHSLKCLKGRYSEDWGH